MSTSRKETTFMGNNETHHVMILEHGITGNHKEMGYVAEALRREYRESKNEKENTTLLVVSATCNDHNSLDGIGNGGLRFANEINEVLRGVVIKIIRDNQQRECNALSVNQTNGTSIALSILGNSMGGLYARYALKYINWNIHAHVGSTLMNVPVIPNVFVTTATPHLGLKNFTYWKVPRFMEPIAGWVMGQSGNDLFRRNTRSVKRNKVINNNHNQTPPSKVQRSEQYNYNDIIEQLSFDVEFIAPLSKFRRRIAYANAFSTDIAVTTATAAFLTDDDNNDDDDRPCCSPVYSNDYNPQDSDDSRSSLLIEGDENESTRSIHMFVSKCSEEEENNNDDASRNHQGSEDTNSVPEYSSVRFDTATTYCSSFGKIKKSSPSVSDMARNLDSLGWSKHFIDNRPHIPKLFKRPNYKKRESSMKKNLDIHEENNKTHTSCYSSGELKRCLSGNGWDGNTLPFGHSFLIASTRDPVHKFLYKSARPFVDQVIAKEVVEEMLQFVPRSEDDC